MDTSKTLISNSILSELSEHNKALIENFKSGNLSSNNEVTFRQDPNYQYADGMLYFESDIDVELYLKSLDDLLDQWDYTNAYQYDNTPNEISYLGDPALNSADALVNFKSLRQEYEKLLFHNINYRNQLDIYIPDPDWKSILNENHEVRIKNNIYKFVKSGIIAVIEGADLNVLDMVRQNGIHTLSRKVRFFSLNQNSFLDSSQNTPPPPPTPPTCNLFLDETHDVNINSFFNVINVDALLLARNADGTSVACTPNYTFDWGDGTQTGPTTDGDQNHTYNASDVGVGDCKEFDVKVTANLFLACGDECGLGDSKSVDIKIQICKPTLPCFDEIHTEEPDAFEFTWDGDDYRIEGEIGQRPETDLFHWDEKLWSTTTFFKRINGNWKKRKPPHNLGAQVFGYIFTNECSTQSNYFEAINWKRKKSITAKHKPNQTFGTRQEGDAIVKGHFMAHMNETEIKAIWDALLWE